MKKNKEKIIVLLDSHAILHRAYHALPSFSSSGGAPTGALYGLMTMILKIINEFKPDHIIAAYDLPKPTFRHVAYDGYKGKRAKTDDELKTQLIASREIFDAFGIPHIDSEGFEADDVIGTLSAFLSKNKETKIIIASGDMDTMQLVEDEKILVYTLKKGINDTILYNEKLVKDRYGFEPKLLVDYKGLRGDPSDNILGVPGIGEKTATDLISNFGTIENIYKNLKKDEKTFLDRKFSPRIIKILKEHEEDALFSKTLATIRKDVPLKFSLQGKSFNESLNLKSLLDICSKYEFRSLVPRVKQLFPDSEKNMEEKKDKGDTNPKLLKEASIAFWVLFSDQTDPSLEEILLKTKKENIKDAYEEIIKELKEQNLLEVFEYIEKPIIPIVEAMENRGVLIDKDHFSSLEKEFKQNLSALEKAIISFAGVDFNVNSPKQLSEVLFDNLKLASKGKRKESGAFTTNAEALEEIIDTHPIIPKILEYRELSKLLSTYVSAIPAQIKEDGRLHARFIQNGTTTGRFSSSDPNLQNLPNKGELGKEIRKGFISPPNHLLLSCDYSQIELRALAILSGDEKLIESFNRGYDIHASVASFMFGVPVEKVDQDMRRKAKTINFGILYGMGVTALQKNLKTSRKEAQEFYNNYFKTFPKISDYMESTKRFAKKNGYTTTFFGRKRYFSQINSKIPFLRAFAERMAANAPIQGTATADLIKLAIGFVDTDLRNSGLIDSAHLIMQIHDELVYEVKNDKKEEVLRVVKNAMENVFERSFKKIKPPIPIEVSTSFGKSLGDVK